MTDRQTLVIGNDRVGFNFDPPVVRVGTCLISIDRMGMKYLNEQYWFVVTIEQGNIRSFTSQLAIPLGYMRIPIVRDRSVQFDVITSSDSY